MTDKESTDQDAVSTRHRVTGGDVRRLADAIRDLDDPAVMDHAWD